MKLSRSVEVAVGMILGQIASAVIAFYMQKYLNRRNRGRQRDEFMALMETLKQHRGEEVSTEDGEVGQYL
jgi:hypothetical protein